MDWNEPERDDPLDDLLSLARWPAVPTDVPQRLEQRWLALRRRRRVYTFAALAASLLLAVAGTVALWPRADDGALIVVKNPPASAEGSLKQPGGLAAEEESATGSESIAAAPVAREANLREQMALGLHRNRKAPRARPEKQKDDPSPSLVAAAIDRLVAKPDSNPAAIALELAESWPRERPALIEAIAAGPPERSQAALRLFARLATRADLALLLEHAAATNCPSEVIDAIGQQSQPDELVALVRNPRFANAEKAWIAELLGRGSTQSVQLYLGLVRDSVTRDVAISALSEVPHPPVEELMAAMSDSRVATRLAAAQALSALGDPAISERLARMAVANYSRREALAALLMSTDSVATQFIEFARHDANLAPTVLALGSRLQKPNIN
jgi:hypothetical protein